MCGTLQCMCGTLQCMCGTLQCMCGTLQCMCGTLQCMCGTLQCMCGTLQCMCGTLQCMCGTLQCMCGTLQCICVTHILYNKCSILCPNLQHLVNVQLQKLCSYSVKSQSLCSCSHSYSTIIKRRLHMVHTLLQFLNVMCCVLCSPSLD